jgi:hypothetical protein
LAPEIGSSLSAAGASLTAADVGATATSLDIAGMISGTTAAADVGATAATAATAVEAGSTLAEIGTFLAEAFPAIASFFSDERLKTDIKPVGKTDEGQTIYTYKYIDNPIKTHMGVMAQETLKFHPEAVIKHPSGALMVNYDKLLGVN